MERTSRIELARRRLQIARRAIGVVAAAGFVVFVFAARASHPGSGTSPAASTSSATPATTSEQDDNGFGFDFSQGSIAPSTGSSSAPSLQSGGS
jgi:hypothetical protein